MWWENNKPLICHGFKATLGSRGTWQHSEPHREVGLLGGNLSFQRENRVRGAESQWGSCTDLVLFMDRTESTEQHPNDGQVIITSSHMQTGISCLQTETKLWACHCSREACTRHGVQGCNNPVKPKRAANVTPPTPANQQCCLPFGTKLSDSWGREGRGHQFFNHWWKTTWLKSPALTFSHYICPPAPKNQCDLESHTCWRTDEEWGLSWAPRRGSTGAAGAELGAEPHVSISACFCPGVIQQDKDIWLPLVGLVCFGFCLCHARSITKQEESCEVTLNLPHGRKQHAVCTIWLWGQAWRLSPCWHKTPVRFPPSWNRSPTAELHDTTCFWPQKAPSSPTQEPGASNASPSPTASIPLCNMNNHLLSVWFWIFDKNHGLKPEYFHELKQYGYNRGTRKWTRVLFQTHIVFEVCSGSSK